MLPSTSKGIRTISPLELSWRSTSKNVRTYPPSSKRKLLTEFDLTEEEDKESHSAAKYPRLLSPSPELNPYVTALLHEAPQEVDTITPVSPRKQKLISLLEEKNKKLKTSYQHIRRLKKQLASCSKNSIIEKLFQNMLPMVKTFVKMQLQHKRGSKWSTQETKLALSMYYKSPTLYRYLLKNLKFSLPSISIIRKWIQVIHLKTGFETNYLNKLKQKILLMDKLETECVLLFDEISIKKSLDYNEKLDLIEGYEDLGDLGRNKDIGNHALVFMARGLYGNWKLPLAYFISGGPVKSGNLQKLVLACLDKMETLNLSTNAIICDQGANNRAVFGKLGVTKMQPYFIYNDKKMFCIHDVPHLMKNVRNTLLKQNIKVGDNYVSWSDIRKTYEIDSSSGLSRTLLKITDKHINPNAFQKMNVKLATQIFSRTFHASMMTAVATKQLNSDTALRTAEFLLKLNNMFDCLNSNGLFQGNYYTRPLSEKNVIVIETLRNAIEYVESWSVPKNTPFCFHGLIQTINGILQLWETKKNDYPYLITKRLNQDPLENLFSQIRQRRGYDPNPSSRHFRLGLQSVMSANLQKCTDVSNCEDDTDILLTVEDHFNKADLEHCNASEEGEREGESLLEHGENKENINPSSSSSKTSSPSSGDILDTTMESNSITYFSGYLFKKVNKKYDCQSCAENLLKSKSDTLDDNEIYMLQRDYGINETINYLKRPKTNFVKIIKTSLNIFDKFISTSPHETNMKTKIIQLLYKNKRIAKWLKAGVCENHRAEMLQLVTRVKLFRLPKNKLECTTKKRKMKIFKHT